MKNTILCLAISISGLGLYGFETELKPSSSPIENNQEDIRSWSNFSDKPLYITTDFTVCRLTCPITMTFYQKMAIHTGDKVKYALFIIDPTNDTTAKLATYQNDLNLDFIGSRK
jgi:cytochrome oxidase Cu insertion factor (SCO1/SenC/PrrC family)